jgi:hypothetical protein
MSQTIPSQAFYITNLPALLPDIFFQLRSPDFTAALGKRTFRGTHGPAWAIQELVLPAVVQALADLIFTANIRNGVLALEPFQDCSHFGLRMSLTAFHAHP